jgi:DNA-binding PadR family transcriptional regulator
VRRSPRTMERLKELLPLTSPMFFILLALSNGENHGYAIMQMVEHLSDRTVRMGPATLYTTLRRLRDLGLIEDRTNVESNDSRRRQYRLTGAGKWLLDAEIKRMENVVRKAKRSLATNALN